MVDIQHNARIRLAVSSHIGLCVAGPDTTIDSYSQKSITSVREFAEIQQYWEYTTGLKRPRWDNCTDKELALLFLLGKHITKGNTR